MVEGALDTAANKLHRLAAAPMSSGLLRNIQLPPKWEVTRCSQFLEAE